MAHLSASSQSQAVVRLSLQIIASKVDWLQLVSKWFIVFINTLSFKQVTSCSMHSIVTTFRGAVIKVEVANFCAAMDTLIDQDAFHCAVLCTSHWNCIVYLFSLKLYRISSHWIKECSSNAVMLMLIATVLHHQGNVDRGWRELNSSSFESLELNVLAVVDSKLYV